MVGVAEAMSLGSKMGMEPKVNYGDSTACVQIGRAEIVLLQPIVGEHRPGGERGVNRIDATRVRERIFL